jgi:hypothetical protein
MAKDRRVRRSVEERFRMKTPSRETAARSAEERASEIAKTARLRELRLAKEAADRDAQQSVAANPAKFKPNPSVGGQTPRRPANEAS